MATLEVSDYLNKRGIEWRRKGDEAVANCPFCQDTNKKFSINLGHGAFQCFRENTCGIKGSFYEFQKMMGDTPISTKKKDIFFNTPQKKNYAKPADDIKPPSNTAIDFMRSRGLTDETIKHFRVGSQNGNTISFPYYRRGELTNIKYRSVKEKKFWGSKDTELILFNRDNIESEELIICEGEFDCMALHQYGFEAVSVPGGAGGHPWVESEWEYLETFKTIYLCFDTDTAGQQGARDLAIKIGEWRCKVVSLPYKDANECLVNGVTAKTIEKCFQNATDFSPETLVTPLFFVEKVINLFSQGTRLWGIKTPWEKVNAILKGWRDGELTVWSGRNGSGKSTILNQVFIDLAEKGVKSCIYSGEMSPERYLRWAVIQHQECEAPHFTKIQETLEWMSYQVYILNITSGIDPEKLLSDFEYAAMRYGVKHFFIDSLMKISFKLQNNGQDEFRQQHEFMNKIIGFAQKHAVHVHLVAHPRKGEKDTDEPGKVDVKGTSHITDLADNVIVLTRVSEQKKEQVIKANAAKTGDEKKFPGDAVFFIKKNREFGTEGSVGLQFNESTKKFTDKFVEKGVKKKGNAQEQF